MKTDEYNYELNKDLIAQSPLENRSNSKLMVFDKKTGDIEHKHFYQIIDYLNKGDALVVNNTKVMPARLLGIKKETGAVIEILLLKNLEDNLWEALAKPQKRLNIGIIITFGDLLKAKVINIKEDGITIIKLIYKGILMEVLEKLGTMPLPPYITKKLKQQDSYQTVYAKEYGSSAAPTAGLHFTSELLQKIKDKGINIVNITLHVGLGTFRPVMVDNISKHEMHSEYYILNKEAADTLNIVKEKGGSIIAVGTTSVRTLETVRQNNKRFVPSSGETNIFIYPGYEFKAVDKLITNFHLPKSTLLMLVSALTTKEFIFNAYDEAIKNNYRFFSFGDAMFIK
ncbi:MAG: tRNA preQ1(34) S-adenosylmethionine ribosyltransferase-isomerase QueA [Bacilli bacterium]|nr:tRNA preQ1(34) S-adenosylmethionine ribosyltransferase-isomerase QueA [Bacilli bacterium]MDD4406939.1 tRNA preQ1(34) S-adenosylmethionine ribosyltransferase-isomerase QueA [Bacilli bacterium]